MTNVLLKTKIKMVKLTIKKNIFIINFKILKFKNKDFLMP